MFSSQESDTSLLDSANHGGVNHTSSWGTPLKTDLLKDEVISIFDPVTA